MLDYQKEILEKKLPFLLEHLVLDPDFFAHIISTRLLSEGSIEDIQAKTTERTKIFRLVEFLKKRPPSGFNEFLTILKSTQQDHIFKELNLMRHQKIKHLPKSPDIEKNVKRKLQSELMIPGRLLSTKDKEIMIQQFVLRADYDEINEDKHILQQDKEKLEMEVTEERKKVEYETRHHQFVKDELDNERSKQKRSEQECKELSQQIARLKGRLEALQQERKTFKQKLKLQQQEIEELKQALETYQSTQRVDAQKEERDEVSNEEKEVETQGNLVHVEEAKDGIQRQMSTRLEHITIVCEEATTGGNVAEFVMDSNKTVGDLEIQMVDLSNGMTKVQRQMHNGECKDVETDQFEEESHHVKNNDHGNDHSLSHPVRNHHRKQTRHIKHVRDNNRVIILETEISVLKSKMKRFEEMLEEQNGALKQKDRQLKEEEQKIVQLRHHLRTQKESSAHLTAKGEHGNTHMVPHPPNYTTITSTTSSDRGYTTQRSYTRKASANLLLKNRQDSMTDRMVGLCHKPSRPPGITTVSYEITDLKAEKSPIITHAPVHQSIISLDMERSCLNPRPKSKSGSRS